MSLRDLFLLIAGLGLVFWRGSRIPLAGWPRWIVMGVRAAAIIALCTALSARPVRSIQPRPRHLVYLVDVSASMDPAQRAWMARRIASLESLRPTHLARALVAFGADTHLVFPFGHDRLTDPEVILRALEAFPVNRDQTNLEAALVSSLAMVPSQDLSPAARDGFSPGGRVGVVLLSDGRETAGHAATILSSVRRLGLNVSPTPPPVFGEANTVWEELAAPSVVQLGSPVSVQLVVVNGASRSKQGSVTLALQGVSIKRRAITIRPGWQVFSVSIPAMARGTMALDVSLSLPEEDREEHRRAYVEVEGPPQLLLVSDRTAALPELATALKRREMEIAVARPDEVPSAVSQLLDYEAVLLFNVPKSAFSTDQVDALKTYVEIFGGGIVMVGLGGDLAHEIQTPSALEVLLPVHFEPKGLQESMRRVCMILLIDRSASMLGPRIAATKRASVELIKQLAPEDLVGVLAFDTKPYVVAEVQPAAQVSKQLVDTLVKLRSSGGTDVYPALSAAANRLELTGATLKHIILLSDGNTPFHEQAYQTLVDSFRLNGTTVSTIGIGSVFVNTDYLKWLAHATGGTFYPLDDLNALPKLVARDVQQALSHLPFTEGRFSPAKTTTTDWFAETSEWPSLKGYLTTTAKPLARVDLTVNGGGEDDPLLARWSVGQGRVVSFTSDADTRWSPDWIRWPGFEGTWAQVVRWAMRPRLTEELFVWVDESRGVPELVLEGTLRDPRAELLSAGDATVFSLSLIQNGSWRWHASLEHVPSGWYQLVVEFHGAVAQDPWPPETQQPDQRQATVFARRWIQVGHLASSQEIAGQPPHESLLRQLAQGTSGTYEMPDRTLLPPTTPVTVTEPPLIWWLPFIIVLLLVDIALRGSSML